MARARNIKPAFFKDPDLADAGPIAQLLFAGLWCLADREGRVKDQPRVIKAELFPYYDADVNGALTVLARLGNIRRYVTKGIAVVEVLNFKKHQSPHHTERESDLPAFDPASVCYSKEHEKDETVTVNSPLRDGGNPPDSLIPDSLIPEKTTLSGKPDHPPVNGKRSEAVEVLDYLNLKAGRSYRPTEPNLKLIAGRLREGATVADCKTVIDRKTDQWRNDDKMREYLRPATLFNATKFSQYQGETGKPNDPWSDL